MYLEAYPIEIFILKSLRRILRVPSLTNGWKICGIHLLPSDRIRLQSNFTVDVLGCVVLAARECPKLGDSKNLRYDLLHILETS